MAALVNIRLVERERLRGLLLPGHIVQISGPPMIGKLTVVDQVLQDMDCESRLQSSLNPVPISGPFIFHRFSCKYSGSRNTVLMNMAGILRNLPINMLNAKFTTEASVLNDLKSILQSTDAYRQLPCHHIIVFEKCETLVTYDEDSWFLKFLSLLMKELRPHMVTIVFTSYKRFEWSGWHPRVPDRMVIGPIQDYDGNVCCTLEVGQLVDNDILCLLQHYAPMVDPSPYLHVFQKFFGFPEAVRKVVQTFLLAAWRQGDSGAFSSETLEILIKTDMTFLHSVFGSRLDEVIDWVGLQNLLILRHLGSSLDSSATRECFRSVATGECDYDRWTVLSYQLQRFYVIRELSSIERIVVHPLVIYFCWTQLKAMLVTLRGQETNLFSNRFTHFLCATLTSLDALSNLKGMQLTVVTNLLHECPNIRHVIGMALLANEDSYGAYLKLAISGGGILGLLCPREVISFFDCLCQRAKEYSRSLIEQAILLGLYGQALAWGTGSNWQESSDHLSMAISILSRPGVEPSYYLLLFLKERGMIQARQGRYDESLRCFKKASKLFGRIKTHALGETFAVTESKLRETEIITQVYQTVPLIFKGNNELAYERLTCLVEEMEQEFPNSIELATAHNQRGLSIQRGRSSPDSIEKAKECYLICMRLRSLFLKVNPIPQYAPLNNVAMLCYKSKDFAQFYSLLDKALQISQQFDWLHYYTGLSLVHLAEGSIGLGNFESALMYLKEGERVLTVTAKDHDLRLRALLELAHVMVAQNQKSSHQQALQQSSQQLACTLGLPSDGQLVPTAARMCKPVTHDDNNKTAKYYLERLTGLAREMKGTLSDDGHHFVLSAYEHALSLNWHNTEEVDQYKTLIFEHVEKNNFVELFMEETPKKYHNLYYHKEVYLYLKQCTHNGRKLDLKVFLSKQVPTCTICTYYGKHFFTERMWFDFIKAKAKENRANSSIHVYHCAISSSASDVTSAAVCIPTSHTYLKDFTSKSNNSLSQCSNKDICSGPLNHPNQTLPQHDTERKSIACSSNQNSSASKSGNTTTPTQKSELLPSHYHPSRKSDHHHCNPEPSANHYAPHIQLDQSPQQVQQSNLDTAGAVGYSDKQFHRFDQSSPFPSSNCVSNGLGAYSDMSGQNIRACLLQSSLLNSSKSQSNQGKGYREPVEDTEPPGAYSMQEDKSERLKGRQPEEDDEGEASGGTNVHMKSIVLTNQGREAYGQGWNMATDSDTSGAWSSLCQGDFSDNQYENFGAPQLQDHSQMNRDVYCSHYVSLTEQGGSDACDVNHNFDSGHGQEKASCFEEKNNNIQQGIRELTLSYSYEDKNGKDRSSSSSGLGSMNQSG